jgi:hypothetical protein
MLWFFPSGIQAIICSPELPTRSPGLRRLSVIQTYARVFLGSCDSLSQGYADVADSFLPVLDEY